MTDTANPWTEAESKDGPPRVPAIFAAMNAVQRALGSFEKTGVGPSTQGSYPFLKVDDIVARLSPALIEAGVITVPRVETVEQEVARFPKVNMDGQPIHDGKAPGIQVITRLRYELDFIAVVDGSKVTAVAHGESQDTGDKGMRRAATQAYKEILLRTFTIVTGEDDPDAFAPQDAPAQVVKQDRGEQMREKAATRAAKKPMPKAPEPEAEAPVEKPEPQPAPPAEPTPEPVIEKAPEPKQELAPDSGWKPDPADVAFAEKAAPSTPAVPDAAPIEQPAVSKTEQRAEDLQALRRQIREAYTERGMTRDDANSLGDHLTGKARAAWFANATDLKRVLKAVVNGEMAPEV